MDACSSHAIVDMLVLRTNHSDYLFFDRSLCTVMEPGESSNSAASNHRHRFGGAIWCFWRSTSRSITLTMPPATWTGGCIWSKGNLRGPTSEEIMRRMMAPWLARIPLVLLVVPHGLLHLVDVISWWPWYPKHDGSWDECEKLTCDELSSGWPSTFYWPLRGFSSRYLRHCTVLKPQLELSL